MNRGLVNLEELRQNFSKADFKNGKSSYVFIKGDKVIKIYANKYEDNYIPKEVVDFSKFKADTIVFPDEYIYENGKVVGEISKYIKSKSIDKTFDDKAIIKNIINGYDKVICDLQLYNNIDMRDLCYVNILYSNKLGFHLIDTTEWLLSNNALMKNIHRFNLSLVDAIVDYLEIPIVYSKYYSDIDKNYLNNIGKYGASGKELKKRIELVLNNRYDFLGLLFAYMSVYQTHYKADAKSLKDINEFTKVLKKG